MRTQVEPNTAMAEEVRAIVARAKTIETLQAQQDEAKARLLRVYGVDTEVVAPNGQDTVVLGKDTQHKVDMTALMDAIGQDKVEYLLNIKRMKVNDLTIPEVKGSVVDLNKVLVEVPCTVRMTVKY